MSDSLLTSLAAVVGPTHVVTDPGVMADYLTDWSGRFHGTALAVVRPGTVEEVSAAVRACVEP